MGGRAWDVGRAVADGACERVVRCFVGLQQRFERGACFVREGGEFGFALAGFSPSIAAALTDGDASKWYLVAGFAIIACIVSGIAVATGPRATHTLPMEELGRGNSKGSSVLAA